MTAVNHRFGAALLAGVVASLSAVGCNAFHGEGPEDPDPLPSPRSVSVKIEYRQQNECTTTSISCDGPVAFFGSWMRPGGEVLLQSHPSSHLWTGVVHDVPVNFPPGDQPYRVRVHDPYLQDTLTEGFTAQRLWVGGQLVLRIDRGGGRHEAGLIFIDVNGQGRNPY